MKFLRVLNIEDSERDHELFRRHMLSRDIELYVERVETAAAMEAALREKIWDVIICDYSMPSFSAPQALETLRRSRLDIPFIIISGTVGEEVAVTALKAGANDYLMKDNLVRLVPAIEREMQDAENRRARSQAETRIRESEARFRSLFKSIPQPVWVYDLETLRFLKVNDAAVDQYGYSRDEFLSMTIKDIRLPEHVPGLMARLATIGARRGNQGIWQHVKKDGTSIEVEIFAHDLQFEDRPARLVLANDVTERRRAEQELIISEERYRDLVENAHDIIYSHDLEGNYTSINKAGELITGYSREEALAMNIEQTVAPESIDAARQMIAAKLEGKEGTAYELDILAKDGRRISVEVNTKLTFHDGVPVGVQGIARDITARKSLEEQLLQAQKLESVGRLAGGIAHDFNNMLTAINGYSDLALRQLPLDHAIRRHIEEIKKAGERSAMLTNQLLAFSRRQVLHPEVVDLNDVIVDTTHMLQRVIGEDVELLSLLQPTAGSVKVDTG
ncbi:MAG TPA: PAS domain S-box protein, partial [Pyrinomonadaceae bacterium]|nr:PAS domain S-box protein [Pyrinomonadaceae bacterium]